MTLTRTSFRTLLGTSLLAFAGLAASATPAAKAAPAAPSSKPVGDAEFAAFLAGGKAGIKMPCRFPDPEMPSTRAEAEAVVEESRQWTACLREHDKRRQRWFDFVESSDRGVAGRLSGAQMDSYRAQLRVAISDDVNATNPLIAEAKERIGEALQQYEWRARPDAPDSVYAPIARRLEAFEYSCKTPSVPRSIDTEAAADAWNARFQSYRACDQAWLDRMKSTNQLASLEAVMTVEDLNQLSFAQTERLFHRWQEISGGFVKAEAARAESIAAFKVAVARMKERSEMNGAAREADERDRRDAAQSAAALREAVRRSGNAGSGGGGGDSGRFVPVVIPKRPGQP